MTGRNYTDLIRLNTFEERFEYLSLKARVGDPTFAYDRHLNQSFYRSKLWRDLRHQIIVRDESCDLGVPGNDIYSRAVIHHIVPMTIEDFEDGNPMMLDPDNLITTTHDTHNAIHYGDRSLLKVMPPERFKNDTAPWLQR